MVNYRLFHCYICLPEAIKGFGSFIMIEMEMHECVKLTQFLNYGAMD